MSKDVFIQACKISSELYDGTGDGISIGGGEPTLHPVIKK